MRSFPAWNTQNDTCGSRESLCFKVYLILPYESQSSRMPLAFFFPWSFFWACLILMSSALFSCISALTMVRSQQGHWIEAVRFLNIVSTESLLNTQCDGQFGLHSRERRVNQQISSRDISRDASLAVRGVTSGNEGGRKEGGLRHKRIFKRHFRESVYHRGLFLGH